MKKPCLTLLIVLCFMLPACGKESNISKNEGTVTVIHADYPYYNTAQELVDSADLVFTGTVENITCEELDVGTETGDDSLTGFVATQSIPYTIYEIRIGDVYKGNVDDDIICIKQPGGQINGNTYILEGISVISQGETYLFLTETYENIYPSLLNASQALYNMNTPEVVNEQEEGTITLSQILEILGN